MSTKAPAIYLPHGGGPMPLFEDPAHAQLISFLRELPGHFQRPRAIILVSAHWEESVVSVYADSQNTLLFDYGGFPPDAYRFTYPAKGLPELADQVAGLLEASEIPVNKVHGRGYDHGMFVPMMLMYPKAEIPCLQLSLVAGLDPAQHIRIGQCLAALREQNVAIIGSGMSFHNMRAFYPGAQEQYQSIGQAFGAWLESILTDKELSADDRCKALQDWKNAPYATFCHPREEHLMPLHVCAGAGMLSPAQLLFNKEVMGHKVLGFGWM